ncbi:MAG: hypothetical protein RLY86_2764 [Pseudomonadota bacterium]|jgi:DNA-binding NarL/FixJ family response regulator
MSMALRQMEARWSGPVMSVLSGSRQPGTSAAPLRSFLIIDGQSMVRHGLAMVMQAASPGAESRHAGDLDSALAQPAPTRPDLVLVDLAALGPVAEGLYRLCRRWPDVAVIVMAAAADPVAARTAFQAGVKAFLLKSDPGTVLEHTVHLVLADTGHVCLPRWLLADRSVAPTAASSRAVSDRDQVRAAFNRLTARQREIFALILGGCSNKEIARRLGVLEGTVKVHVRTMMQKLGVTNRTQVALLAARCGLKPAD